MTKFVFTISHPAELNPKTAGQLVKEALGCTGRVNKAWGGSGAFGGRGKGRGRDSTTARVCQ